MKRRIIAIDNEVASQGDAIAGYDRKRMLQAIHTMMREVEARNNVINKRQFAFKGDPIPPPAQTSDQDVSGPGPTSQAWAPDTAGANSSFDSLNGCLLVINEAQKHVVLSNITNSVVFTVPPVPPASVHVRSAHDVILRVDCAGPIFVHDVVDAVLILQCHQLRLHNVRNSVVVVDVSNNRAVIENCNGLTVGTQAGGEVAVDDFNWPTTATNPHYHTLSPGQARQAADWAARMEELVPSEVVAHIDLIRRTDRET